MLGICPTSPPHDKKLWMSIVTPIQITFDTCTREGIFPAVDKIKCLSMKRNPNISRKIMDEFPFSLFW